MVLRLDIVVRVVTKNVQNQLAGGTKSMMGFGRAAGFAAAALGALAASKVSDFVSDAGRTFAKFENELRRATAVSVENLGSAEELNRTYQDLERTARQLGLTTVFTATEAAEGLFFLGQAGLTAEESMVGIVDVLNLAQIGAISLAQSSEIATDIMAGMALQVEELGRVVDVMTAAFTSSNQTVTELGTAFSKAGPFARLLGFELEEVAGALSVLANAGIKGTEGGAALRNVFLRLLNPTADNMELLNALGLSAENVASGMFTLQDIMFKIKDAVDDGTLSVADLAEIFQVRAVTAVGAFIASMDDTQRGLVAMEDKMRSAEGTAASMTDFINDSAFFAYEQLRASIEELKIELGAELAPAIIGIINAFRANRGEMGRYLKVLGDVLKVGLAVFINMMDEVRKKVVAFMDAGGADAFKAVGAAIKFVIGDGRDLGKQFGVIIQVILALVVGAGALIAVGIGISRAFIEIAKAGARLRNVIKSIGIAFKDSIVFVSTIIRLITGLVFAFDDLGDRIDRVAKSFEKYKNSLKDFRSTSWDFLSGGPGGVENLPLFQSGGSFKVRKTGAIGVHQGEQVTVTNPQAGQTTDRMEGGVRRGRELTINNTFHVANPDAMLMRRETEKYLRDMRRR